MDLRFVYFLVLLGLVQPKLINLKCNGIYKFVNGHNTRRLRLAKGEVSGQPAASKMNYMVWNEELAEKAAQWAARNQFGHNPDKTIPSKRFNVGENIYKYSTTDTAFRFDPEMAMTEWFNEYKDFTYKRLESSDFADHRPMVGHYTQMAWSKSVQLGCAVSRFMENMNGKKYVSHYVVCNYGPLGNFMGEFPYNSGQASRTLICRGGMNCNQPYGNSC